MKTKNAITVSPAPGFPELKRAKNLIRITERILATPVPVRNRTDEHGRKQGHWVERDDDGGVQEGAYKDGKRHGHWVFRFANGDVDTVEKGPFVDGERHGRWVMRRVHCFGGTVEEGPFANGKRHGHWVLRCATCTGKTVERGSFVDGEKHGQWVVRFVTHGDEEADGDVEVVCYENGYEVEC